MKSFFRIFDKEPKAKEPDYKNWIADSTAGTEIFSGDFFEEYLAEILGNQWAKTADRMRRSSDQINMLLTLTKSPIINATWQIDGNEEDGQQKRIKEFLEFNFFEKIDFSQFIEEALTFFEFGHSVFEVVYSPLINDFNFPSTICLKKLSYISQKTIEDWHVNRDGTLRGIRQCADGDLDVDVEIVGNKLLVFTINKEGANYEGRSLLRPILGNWKRKQEFLKLLAIGIERTALGTPIAKLKNNSPEQRRAMKKILKSFISHQKSSMVINQHDSIESFDIKFNANDVREAIRDERIGMSQSFLAGFMDMSINSSSGSFALSDNLLKMFLGQLQHYANKITFQCNNIIKTLTDINFGKQQQYFKLKAGNIADRINKEFIEQILGLTDKGYLEVTPQNKEFLRKKMGMPEGEPQEVKEEKESDIDNNFSMDFAERSKKKANTLIKNNSEALRKLMQSELTRRRDKILEGTAKILNNPKIRNKRNVIISQPLPDKKAYSDLIIDFLLDTSITATNQAKSELGLIAFEFAEKENFKKVSKKTRERLKTEVALIIGIQEADLSKNLYFPANNEIDNTDSTNKIIENMKLSSDRYIEGPAITTGATNFVSNAVNNARNDLYQMPEVFEEIESFTIINPSPEAAICKELAGRTITREEYKTGDLPPYHHNCNTIVVANKKGASNNPKISPLGLSITGTPDRIEKIKKSKTF